MKGFDWDAMPDTAAKPLNVLFITTDQQRRDTMGCYGNALIRTPNLDRLAAGGMALDRAYCENPICIPSRNTIINGLSSRHHGAPLHNNSVSDGIRTLPQALGERGYATAIIGKAHLKSQQHRGTEESIADWRDGKRAGWHGPFVGFERADLVLGHSNPLVGHYGEWLRREHPAACRHFMRSNLEHIKGSGPGGGAYRNAIPEELHSSRWVADRTCAFIERAAAEGRPFFCFAGFPDPHWPIMPPRPWFDMYADTPMPPNIPYNGEAEKDNYPRIFAASRGALEWRRAYNGGGRYMTAGTPIDAITRAYWGAISFIDDNVGRMLAALDRLGLAANTLVVFTTDHGEYMGAHGLIAKGGFFYDALLRVPFIARWPGVAPGSRSEALFSFVDIAPTLLSLLGVADAGMQPDGISQASVLAGGEALRERLTVFQATIDNTGAFPDIHALITPDWKLNHYAGDPGGELYHVHDDPRELNNLYNRPEAADTQRALTQALLDEIILTNDRRRVAEWAAADSYGRHVMDDDTWKPEFDELANRTRSDA